MSSKVALVAMFSKFINSLGYEDMGAVFDANPITLNKCVNLLMEFTYYKFARKLKHRRTLDRYTDSIRPFCEKIRRKLMNPSNPAAHSYTFTPESFNICMFIDGCLKKSTRAGSGPIEPGQGAARRPHAHEIQQANYSGYCKFGGVKFLQGVYPNGMCAFATRLYALRRTDQHAFNHFDVEGLLANHCQSRQNGRIYCAYTDLGFVPTIHSKAAFRIEKKVSAAFREAHPQFEEIIADCMAQDNALNRVRECGSEHKNAMDVAICKFLDDWKSFKWLSNEKRKVHLYRILIALFLVDLNSCVHGNQISETFDCDTPSLEEYFVGLNSLV